VSRFDTYFRGDTTDFTDGDARFTGVDMTRDRGLLQPGQLAAAQNTRLRTGGCGQRKGTTWPVDFNPTFTNAFAGSGIFRDPNGNEVLLIAARGAQEVIVLQYGKDPLTIPYSATEQGSGRNNGNLVEFVQSFDKVQLLRRPIPAGSNHLVWDGDPGGEFTVVTLSPTGLNLILPQWNGESFQDRVIYYDANFPAVDGRDGWFLSDILDYTSYNTVYGVGRTNPGESDYITRIKAYYQNSFIVFKNQSIHQVSILSQFPVAFSQRILSVRLGSCGNKMPLEVGGDIIFLSEPGGFFRLSQVIQDSIVTLPVAISEQIQPFINGLNWAATRYWGCSASVDNYGLFGVAVGGAATRCNAILVYNTQNSEWESVADTWKDPTFGFNQLHVTNYQDVRRVFAIDNDNAVVYLLYEGYVDDLKSGLWSVPYKMETRGYAGQDPFSMKMFRRSTITISTFTPSIKVTAISDGFNEEKLLTPSPITKSRLEFYTHGKTFDPLTDDHDAPFRKDYSIPDDSNVAIEDFENLPDGPIAMLPPTVIPDAAGRQQSIERLLIRGSGRWVSLRVENDDGACDVLGTSVEGTRTMNTIRAVA